MKPSIIRTGLVCLCFSLSASLASAGDLSKTLIAADIAEHLNLIEQGMDLISEFSLSPSDVRKIATEIRGGAYEDFQKPKVKMTDSQTIEIVFEKKPIKLSFKTLERQEVRLQGKPVNLKGSKTYANYGTEIDKILHIKGHKANEVTGVLSAAIADVGYRMASSSMRDYGGAKARSAASEEKNTAADIIGFYRAEHARCVRSRHDGEREVGEFCSSEKFHPECAAAQHQAEQNCETRIDSYFVCKETKVIATGTWDVRRKGFVKQEGSPSRAFVKEAFGECCEEQGCYKAVRHDLVDLYFRGPASDAPAVPAPGSTTLPVQGLPHVAPPKAPDSSQAEPAVPRPSFATTPHLSSRVL